MSVSVLVIAWGVGQTLKDTSISPRFSATQNVLTNFHHDECLVVGTMASTFRRRTTAPATASQNPEGISSSDSHHRSLLGLKGTKPWTGGITLTSTGLREWDALLGGAGQPLGTVVWLQEDRWTTLSLSHSLIKYWCAEVCQTVTICCVVESSFFWH